MKPKLTRIDYSARTGAGDGKVAPQGWKRYSEAGKGVAGLSTGSEVGRDVAQGREDRDIERNEEQEQCDNVVNHTTPVPFRQCGQVWALSHLQPNSIRCAVCSAHHISKRLFLNDSVYLTPTAHCTLHTLSKFPYARAHYIDLKVVCAGCVVVVQAAISG